MTATANGKINDIELPARDIESTKRFFSSAFGFVHTRGD